MIRLIRFFYPALPTPDEVRRQALEQAQRELIVAASEYEDARARFDKLKARVQRLEREVTP